MKFSEIKYERPNLDAEAESLRTLAENIRGAKCYEELRELYLEHEKAAGQINDMTSIAHIRNTVDTRDPFYEGETKYISEVRASLSLESKKVGEALLSSPFAKDFSDEFGDMVLKNLKNQQLLTNEATVKDKVRESELSQEYSKTVANASTLFRGEECNFYGLLKHMESTDRAERREAFEAWSNMYAGIADRLDEIYDEMVSLRCGMAKKLGFDSYIDMVYLQRRRFDYTAKDVAVFRRQVKDVVVPACARLYERQRERLGVDKLHYYDEALVFPDGNAIPKGDRDTLVGVAQNMYRELSPETGEFFDKMVECELFDLETKPGKRGGGYCSSLPGMKMPFIFSNFNGTSADVDVLTHEAGHAFAYYTASRNQPIGELCHTTSEVAEIHSMTMELWTYPWMKNFFGEEQTPKYLFAHLSSALTVIPYMVAVDEFQHRVFEKPEMTAKERRAVWHELEGVYLPWRDYDGNEFLEEGGFWMQKQHIFLFPFYYIDYAMAQMCAFEFYTKMKKDRQGTWEDYCRLCRIGGRLGYFDTLKYANLHSPLERGAVANATAGVFEDLGL